MLSAPLRHSTRTNLLSGSLTSSTRVDQIWSLASLMGKRKHEASIDITEPHQPSVSHTEHDVIDLANDTPTPPGKDT